jgi:hypothetical protein
MWRELCDEQTIVFFMYLIVLGTSYNKVLLYLYLLFVVELEKFVLSYNLALVSP